ncbi:MAG: TIGR04076 family protein [Bullifex sp.]
MRKVKLTVLESRCRSGVMKAGQEFIICDVCPPVCHELWNIVYPSVYALLCGGVLDYGKTMSKEFDACCPDGGRVIVHGEVIDK